MSDGLELLKPFLPGLEDVLEDPDVSEIMINGPAQRLDRRTWKALLSRCPAADRRGASKGRHPYRPSRSAWTRPRLLLSMLAWMTARGLPSVFHRPARRLRSPCGGLANGHSQRRTWVEQGALPRNVKEAAEKMLHTRRNILVSGGNRIWQDHTV